MTQGAHVVLREDRIAGGIWGLLVGDALGVPYESRAATALPSRESLELEPPESFPRAYWGVPAGTWSDDGAQALCLLASLLDCDRFDAHDFAQRLVGWHRRGDFTADGRVFGVGVQTQRVLTRIAEGVPLAAAAPADERSNGNGSLMRALPLALWHRESDERLVEDAHAQSRVTHAHPRSQVCVALYSLWARAELEGAPNAWRSATETLGLHYRRAHDGLREDELERIVLPAASAPPTGKGYVVDSLHSAHAACGAGSYEAIVKSAIAFGNDTDTTACIAGGIAGIRHGVDGIPERWRRGLRGRAVFEPLVRRLLARSPP